jgi:hypothetical protein
MLPKQTLPIFELIVPSTKQKIKFRQFTVREEKLMAQAEESEDLKVIANAVREVISLCTVGIKDVDALALFDIEYIITKIRAKSVGEIVELVLPCDVDSLHERAKVPVDLDKAEVIFPEGHQKKIHLFGDVGIMMKYPSFADLENFANFSGLDAIIACIDYIYDNDEVHYKADQTKEELEDFINSLTEKQIMSIEELFLKKMPVFEYWVTYKCPTCGKEHKKVIKGLANFFV